MTHKLCLVSLLVAACSAADLKVIKQVQPDYSGIGTAYIVDRASVRMLVAGDGVPFSIESDVGLPENVVHALSEWRYQPFGSADQGVTLPLIVPVQRALSPVLERQLCFCQTPSPETASAVTRGESLDAANAAALLAALQPNEEPELNRTALIAYYAKHPSPESNQQRAALVLWLIEHYPQAGILASSYAVINPAGPLADPENAKKARELWLAATAQYPNDYVVVQHAANFLKLTDYSSALSLLRKFPNAKRHMTAIGYVYAYEAMGVDGVDLESGRPISISKLSPEVIDSVLKSNNTEFVLTAARTFISVGQALAAHGHLPAGYESLCDSLADHAKQLYPGTTASCAGGPDDSSLQVHSKQTLPKLTKKINPSYTKKARKERLSGTLLFAIVVGADGNPKDVNLLRGVLGLYEPSRNALLQWEFQPGMIDGHPVDTPATVEVTMKLL